MNGIKNKITMKYPYSTGIEKGENSRYRYPNGIYKRSILDQHWLRPTFIISSTSSRVGGSFQGPGTVLLISLPHIRKPKAISINQSKATINLIHHLINYGQGKGNIRYSTTLGFSSKFVPCNSIWQENAKQLEVCSAISFQP